MSCPPTPTTTWIQLSSTYDRTEYVTSARTITTTATTVVPVLNRWCTASAEAAETPPASGLQSMPVLANNFAAPTPAPACSHNVLSISFNYKTDRRFKDSHKHVNHPRYHQAPQARSTEDPSSKPSKYSGTLADVGLHKGLAPRDEPNPDQCIAWATETQWVTLEPTFTETLTEVATNIVPATTQVWVPSVTSCVQTQSSSSGVNNVANQQWKLNTAVAAASGSTITSTAPGISSTYTHAMAQPHVPSFIATTLDSSATLQGSSNADLGIVASSVQSNRVSAKDDQTSSKLAWGCGALGATIFIGILAWVVFDRRKKSRARRNANEEERQILEEKRFFDDWQKHEDDGDSNLPAAPVPFGQVALDSASEAKEDKQNDKHPRLMSRFSAGSSLREVYDLRGPLASAFVRPLSVFGQSRPKKHGTIDVGPAKVMKSNTVSPRPYPEPTLDHNVKTPRKQAFGFPSIGGPYSKIETQSKAKPHYRTVARGDRLSIAAVVPTMISEEPEFANFSTLSPASLNTGRSLTTAFSPSQRQQHDLLGMSGEGEHLQTPLEPVGRILSVGEMPPYEEPAATRQVAALPLAKHESGWYTKSILRDWLPSSSRSRSVKGYAV